jgi:hypothetical protein
VEGSDTLKDTENSLDHWIAVTYIIDAQTVETVAAAALCTIYHKGYFEPLTFLIKDFIYNILVLIYSVSSFLKKF